MIKRILLISAASIVFIAGALAYERFFLPRREERLEGVSERLSEETASGRIPTVSLSSETLYQAQTLVIRADASERPRAMFKKKSVDFFESKPDVWVAVIGIDAREAAVAQRMVVEFANGERIEKEITVQRRDWPVTELKITKELAQQGYTPSAIAQNIVHNENKIVNDAMARSHAVPYFSDFFVDPLDTRITVGAYGNIRKSGDVSLQHLGADFDADTGDSVYSVNEGVVALSQAGLPNYGTTVIVDHGLGIFSLYLHLNEVRVKAGDAVARGQTIGYAGNTGYSISPHLHFSIKVRGASVDPIEFIETMNQILR